MAAHSESSKEVCCGLPATRYPALPPSVMGWKFPSSQQWTKVSVTDFSSSQRPRIFVASAGLRDHGEEVGEFLDDLVGGGNQKIRVRIMRFGVADEKATGPLTDPLHQPWIVG